jgi:adenine-specific DNA methylase
MSAILANESPRRRFGNAASAGERIAREAKFVSTLPSTAETNIATSKAAIGGRLAASQKSFETGTKRDKKEFWDLLEDGTKQAHAAVLGIPENDIPRRRKERAFSKSSAQPSVTPGAAPAPEPRLRRIAKPTGRDADAGW